jgi:hypothetical protein
MFDMGPPLGGGMMSFMFTVIPILVIAVFVLAIVRMAMSGARYVKNASAPRQTVFARVVAKRMDVRQYTNHHHHGNDAVPMTKSSRTYYYITLEFDNGERKEYLDVKNLYGLVVEGDTGYAATQGDWIVGFERNTG